MTLTQFHTTEDVSKAMKVSARTLLRYVAEGLASPVKLPGGYYRWTDADVRALEEALRVRPVELSP